MQINIRRFRQTAALFYNRQNHPALTLEKIQQKQRLNKDVHTAVGQVSGKFV